MTISRDITARKEAEIDLSVAYQKEHRIAESLQRSLLFTPDEDAFPGLAVAMEYEPAWDEAQVGGDFYDAFALEENKVALVVGDVCGKGLAAASCTSQVKFTLRAFLREYPQPAIALERLNNILLDGQQLDTFAANALVCLTLAVVDTETETGEAAVACARAEPPLLLRAGREVEEIATGGLVLGALPKAEYPATLLRLQSGDTLLLVTDGITEARTQGIPGVEFFGPEGLAQAARKARAIGGPLPAMAAALMAAAKQFAGGKLGDDVCLLLARRR